jgi:hypothetical protein
MYGVILPAEATLCPAITRTSPSIPSTSQLLAPISCRYLLHSASAALIATQGAKPSDHYAIVEPRKSLVGCCDKYLSQHLNANLNYLLICQETTTEIIPFARKPKFKVCGFSVCVTGSSTIGHACEGTPGPLSLLVPSYLFNKVDVSTDAISLEWLYWKLRIGTDMFDRIGLP